MLEDLNEDGIDDIASIESSSVKVYFSANNKWVGNKIAERLKEPVSLSAADFNGDGFMDLAVGCGGEVKNSSDTGLGIISGMKGNAFSRPVFFDGGPGVSDVAWGDINGDKVMDLVTASFGNHKANIFLNQENQLVHSDSLPAGWSPSAILARDINGDGQTELLILNKWGKNLYIWENRTQGNRDAPDK